MQKARFAKRLSRIGLLTVASLLMLGNGSLAFAQRHGGGFGGFHGGAGFHGGGFGGFHGFRGGGFHGGFGDFHGSPGYHGGAFGGFHGGPGYHGYYGYRGFGPRGPGWGWGPWWGVGLGLYLPVLPWYYTTFWWNDVPYYYVQNDYYVWDADANEYEQVQPPAQVAQQAQDGQAAQGPTQLYAYPKKGQTAQQQATDKRECSKWASAQTGLNPTTGAMAGGQQTPPGNGQASSTKPGDGGAAPNANTPASAQQWQDYLRAEGACLEARGYSVE